MASEPLTRNGLYGFEIREDDRRRVEKDEPRHAYDIKQMWQRHHEIVNLAAQGLKQTDIAELLGINPQTVSNTLNSELGQRKLSELRGDRDLDAKLNVEKIKGLVSKAIDTYHEAFDDNSGQMTLKDKVKVAETVLNDLSGLKAPTKIQSESTSLILSKIELQEFKKRGIEAARESGLVIDVPDEPKQIPEGT